MFRQWWEIHRVKVYALLFLVIEWGLDHLKEALT